jgi:hypothetical protein
MITIYEAKKKLEAAKKLISEHGQLSAMINFMQKDGIKVPAYYNNILKRRDKILVQLDELFK